MFSQGYYLIRSRADGQYLVAHPNADASHTKSSYLLLFSEHSDALSYLNTHGAHVVDRFAVEAIAATHLKPLLQRWGFTGIGIVEDPLVPTVQFLSQP